MKSEITDYSGYGDVMRAWLWLQLAVSDVGEKASENGKSGDNAGMIKSMMEEGVGLVIESAMLEEHSEFPSPELN